MTADVGVVISDSWDDPQWLINLADDLSDADDVAVLLKDGRRSETEHHLWFVGCALGRMRCVIVPSIAKMCSRADRLLLLGPKEDRRLRRIRAEAKKAGVDYRWRSRRPKKKIRVLPSQKIGRSGYK